MKTYKKTLIVLICVIVISLCLLSYFLGKGSFDDTTLSPFSIIKVENVDNYTTLFFEKSKNAKHYVVIITDNNENIINQIDTEKNRVSIQNTHAEYNQNININVIAFNKNEENLKSSNTLKHTWTNPSFDDENNKNIVTKNQDYSIKILGDVYNSKYTLKILYKNNSIYKKVIDSNYMLIPYEKIKSYQGRLTAVIYDQDDNLIHQSNFYNSPVIVGSINITSPEHNTSLYWDEVKLTYSGGENATAYKVNVYKGNKLVTTIKGYKKNEIVIPANVFKENTTYKLELIATYQDYEEISKKSSIFINIGTKKAVSPVYTTYNPENITKGTYIELLSRTEDAQIKYTLDGSNPLKKGIIYNKPIKIEKDVTIRAIAIKNNLKDSTETTFNFKTQKKEIVVYLSPSNQYKNLGVNSVGYTNEREMMNKVSNLVEEKLKKAGIKVYRNDPNKDMMEWLSESRKVKADLHLAIHSNGSVNHDKQGMEIYVNDETSKMLSLATLMYSNLYSIYPYKNAINDRGIKYADGSLGEVNPLNTQRGILIEIAHHDYKDDAKWMVDNLEQISNNIANSIISYYQLN